MSERAVISCSRDGRGSHCPTELVIGIGICIGIGIGIGIGIAL